MTATASDAAPAAVHFRFFELEVLRTRRLGHSFLRVTFGGESLAGFRSGGYDQSLSLFLPPSHQEHTVLPSTDEDTWFGAWRGMPDEDRPVMRSYTVREQRRTPEGVDEVDIDFVLHGDACPASAWAGRAVSGRRIMAIGPAVAENKSVRFQPPAATDAILMYADETALPAAAAILDRLADGTRVKAWFEVPHADDRLTLSTRADVDITWIVRAGGAGRERTEQVLSELRTAELPAAEAPYAWIAGEAGTIRAVRRHLVQERSVDRRAVRFTGYWRLGASEEELLAEAYAGQAASEDPTSDL
ncbi:MULTISPECIES: siderophore-interacting protein [unclassified Streptomyces]|uniref:siderophore-interacting protein n=1 Tax=unclassified Streptomyces TaxID=2593676 RepID=UPI001BE7D6F6|nr:MULTISPECIES: siderophore-interacting protein [unclassified Streptomyces]MBT2402586.1 siderophore-interacting protein [Streptomyces sp. ISL-21]MBT2607979.1 siderophore-interacting protein [Streptomyces sp. ISL-87]